MTKKKWWLNPIFKQWPVFLAWIVLVGWTSLLQNPYYRWFVIFLHAWLVSALVHLSRSRIIKTAVYVIAFTLFFIEAMLENCFDLAISPSTLTLVVETTPQETHEFFETITLKPTFWLTLAIGFALSCMAVVAECNREVLVLKLQKPKVLRIMSWLTAVMLAVGLLTSICYIKLFQSNNVDEVSAWNLQMRHPSDALTRVAIAFFDTHLVGKEMDKAIASAKRVPSATIALPDTLHVIFVIGESYIRQHSPLYGYALNTTPFMLSEQQQDRLVAFTDVVSPYNLTTLSVRNIISCNSIASGERWSETPPLTAVFKKAGFHVSMYDNQRTFSFASTQTYALNNYLYAPKITTYCYDYANKETYPRDAELVDACHHHIPSDATRTLTVFHLMGQHARFEQRYPADDARFQHFTADSIRRSEPWMTDAKRTEIARYDNATLYNDYVIEQICQLYADKNTVMVYLSDHGEEVYDYRDNIGRSLGGHLPDMLSYQYGVPLVVWCSDRYRERHPDVMERLQQSKDRPMMTDNVCQLLFHLAGLTASPYYNHARDVLSPDYQCGQRLLNDRWDYDEIKKNSDKQIKNNH